MSSGGVSANPTQFPRPTRSALISSAQSDINGRVTGADSRLRRSFLSAFAYMLGGGLDGLYGALAYVADQVMPDSADAAHLARWASIWGVFPKTATAAIGSAANVSACTNGVDVPAGTVLQRGDQVTYTTTADATTADAGVTLAIECSQTGSIGGNAAGIILTLVSPIAGVSSQFTVSAEMDGADAETPPELLGRLLARIQYPPNGGGPGDYVAWALEVAGVTRAWEYPNWDGLGTVGVAFVFDDRADIFPLEADVTAMQTWLDGLAPITAAVTAFALTAYVVPFTIDLVPSNAATKAAVTAELQAWMTRESVPNATLLKSHYDDVIQEAAGVTDHTVSVPAGNIDVPAGQLAVLGAITWD